MHLQRLYAQYETIGGDVAAEGLFRDGLCLPSGSQLTEAELDRVAGVVLVISRNADFDFEDISTP